MINNGLFSSNNHEWETPDHIYESMDSKYHFTLDVCATDDNTKCDRYYTKEEDGLKGDWDKFNWCNPPYGRELPKWIEKAYKETLRGNTTVVLMPARTDTKYFHEYIWDQAINSWRPWIETVYMIKGRIKFKGTYLREKLGIGGRYYGMEEVSYNNSAPFPSMLVVFSGKWESKKMATNLASIIDSAIDFFKYPYLAKNKITCTPPGYKQPYLSKGDLEDVSLFMSQAMSHVVNAIRDHATIKYGNWDYMEDDTHSYLGRSYTRGYNDAVRYQRELIVKFISGGKL